MTFVLKLERTLAIIQYYWLCILTFANCKYLVGDIRIIRACVTKWKGRRAHDHWLWVRSPPESHIILPQSVALTTHTMSTVLWSLIRVVGPGKVLALLGNKMLIKHHWNGSDCKPVRCVCVCVSTLFSIGCWEWCHSLTRREDRRAWLVKWFTLIITWISNGAVLMTRNNASYLSLYVR